MPGFQPYQVIQQSVRVRQVFDDIRTDDEIRFEIGNCAEIAETPVSLGVLINQKTEVAVEFKTQGISVLEIPNQFEAGSTADIQNIFVSESLCQICGMFIDLFLPLIRQVPVIVVVILGSEAVGPGDSKSSIHPWSPFSRCP